jgi:lysozyme family protein
MHKPGWRMRRRVFTEIRVDHFDTFIRRLLSHEGGYTNDRRDPGNWTGGAVGVGQLKGTKFGIAANTYPDLDIRNLTLDQAMAIYRRDFWDRAGCNRLPPVVAFQLLDGAVNSGIPQALRWLQRAAGVAADGVIGPVTLAAIKRADPNDVVLLFNALRIDFMTRLKNWGVHGAGWMRRIAANLTYAAGDN